MPSWEDVRRIAGALPDVVESTHYGQPAFKTADRAFVNVSGREADAIVVRCTIDEQLLLCRARPDVYFMTPHYEGWTGVLVRMSAVDDDELAGALEDSYAFVRALPAKRPASGRTRRGSR